MDPSALSTPDARTSSSPSPSSIATPTTGGGELETVRQEYAAFRAKATQWKHAVKAQLEEAAAKNATLRNELKDAHSRAEQLAAATRLQLTSEFKDRTALKFQECDELNLKIGQLKQQIIDQTEASRVELAQALDRRRDELAVEHEVALQRAQAQHDEAARSTEQKQRKIEALNEKMAQENAVISAKLRQLQKQLDDEREAAAAAAGALAASSHSNSGADDAFSSQAASAAARLTSAELEKATSQISDLQREVIKLRHDVEEAHKEKASEIQRVEAARESEVLRRSEQLLVLQTLLKQSHQDNSTFQQRLDQLVVANATLEHAAHEKIAALSQDLFAKMSQLDEATGRAALLETNLTRALQQVRSLEEEATCRERAFSDLMLSDDSKHIVAMATQERDDAVAALEAAERRNAELIEMVDNTERSAALRHCELEQREVEIQKKSSEVDGKLDRLRQESTRLREQHVQLSAQAQQLVAMLPPNSGGQHNNSNSASSSNALSDHSDPSATDLANLLSWTNVRHHYFAALRQGGGSRRAAASILFQSYRRVLPVIILGLLAFTIMYWWAFSGATSSTSGDKSLRKFADMLEELGAMKREYRVVAQRLAQCCNITVDPVSLTSELKKI